MLRIERREKEILRRKGNECSSQNSYFRLLNAAVPLSISCCRKESSFNLGSAETKLLYTLHWILLDAADECVLESESAGNKFEMGPFDYLFPLPAITVNTYIHTKYVITTPPIVIFRRLIFFQSFVYLFAPICGHIRESDFMQNTRLDNGKRIWKALWEYRHPDVECFVAQVCNLVPLVIRYVEVSLFLQLAISSHILRLTQKKNSRQFQPLASKTDIT